MKATCVPEGAQEHWVGLDVHLLLHQPITVDAVSQVLLDMLLIGLISLPIWGCVGKIHPANAGVAKW